MVIFSKFCVILGAVYWYVILMAEKSGNESNNTEKEIFQNRRIEENKSQPELVAACKDAVGSTETFSSATECESTICECENRDENKTQTDPQMSGSIYRSSPYTEDLSDQKAADMSNSNLKTCEIPVSFKNSTDECSADISISSIFESKISGHSDSQTLECKITESLPFSRPMSNKGCESETHEITVKAQEKKLKSESVDSDATLNGSCYRKQSQKCMRGDQRGSSLFDEKGQESASKQKPGAAGPAGNGSIGFQGNDIVSNIQLENVEYSSDRDKNKAPLLATPVEEDSPQNKLSQQQSQLVTSVYGQNSVAREAVLQHSRPPQQEQNSLVERNYRPENGQNQGSVVYNRIDYRNGNHDDGGDGGGDYGEANRRLFGYNVLTYSVTSTTQYNRNSRNIDPRAARLQLTEADENRIIRYFGIKRFGFLWKIHETFYFQLGNRSVPEVIEIINQIKSRLEQLLFGRFYGTAINGQRILLPSDLVCTFGIETINGHMNNIPSTKMVV